MYRFLLILAQIAGFAMPSFAAENPWLGTWKLDVAKSNFTGDTFIYSKLPNGMMHFSDGVEFSYDFGIDGKPYEMISADGKTLTWVSTGNLPDATTYKVSGVYTRVSGSSGLEGKWRYTKVTISSAVASVNEEGTMKWESPSYLSAFEGKTDGSDILVTGPTVPPGMVVTMKATTPGVLSLSSKLGGKTLSYDIQTLAADGKSYTDVSWSPGKESEKTTSVYVKQ